IRDEIFKLENYNNFVLQSGIDIFNKIIGGLGLENGGRHQGLNEKINNTKLAEYSKYKQAKKDGIINNFKKSDFPIFRELYKQILGNKDIGNQKFLEIETENDLIKKYIPEFIEKNNTKIQKSFEIIDNLFLKSEEYDLGKIYISKISLNTLSAKFFANWHLIADFLPTEKDGKGKESIKEFVSLEDIKSALEKAKTESECDLFKKEYELVVKDNTFEKFLHIFNNEFGNNIINIKNNLENLEKEILILDKFDQEKTKKEEQIGIIKDYCDGVLNLYRMMKYFALEKDKTLLRNESDYKTDDAFYNEFDEYYNDYEIIKYYNEFRNFLTKKPYSKDKVKLNFDNGTLLDGWDKNKEPDNYGTILRQDGKYYLGLMKKGNNHIFRTDKKIDFRESEENFYEKMEYKFFPDAAKMIPKCSTQLNKVQSHFLKNSEDVNIIGGKIESDLYVSKRIFDLNNVYFDKREISKIIDSKDEKELKNGVKKFQKEYFKLSGDFEVYKSALIDWIDFCKAFLKVYESTSFFNFDGFKESEEYESLDEFYKDVDALSYNVSFTKIGNSYIEEKVKLGELYLFEIYNKDFAENKSGKENLHTMYFKGLFEEKNLQKPVLKLNGQAEIFFRPASLNEKIDKERKTNNEIIENKRYTKDKILFHCPIKLNFSEHNEKINGEINNFIAGNSEKIKILGIDRGEKHLAYYSLIEIDETGNAKIIDSGSFNTIFSKDENGEIKKENNLIFDNKGAIIGSEEKLGKDYYNLLNGKEKERANSRESWKNIENIKELKEGYISQIVHKITKIAVENNAIIVFEDLNMGFKRGRQKIEKQIYQKLEKALIKKFNYLVFKDKKANENGNYLKAIQLTAPFTTFKEIGKQTGLIFYTDASYTSTTCPNCGWRKDVYIKYKNKESAEKDFKKFDKIYFDNKKNSFVFEYKPVNFGGKIKEVTTVFSNRERIKTSRDEATQNQFTSKEIDVTQKLKDSFEKALINYKNQDNLINQIIEKGMIKIDERNLFQNLYYYLSFVLQIRNSKTGDNSRTGDFILCPRCDFDSRNESEIGVKNGDDNGAFNIARKGILIVENIKSNPIKPNLYISKDEWDIFARRIKDINLLDLIDE
ncbi:MAG: type V CRISPR-associated protein Cas12a/Cpf1, partial [Candidatus Gracilibacteria bacterium]|nr:type V CRISPR-associated protein Cas12a/Cpf1 [Candidatus Gracilibacteria bacterium]